MVTIVIDTNVFVAAFFNPRSASSQIIDRCLDGEFKVLFSDPVLNEIDHILDCVKASREFTTKVSSLVEQSDIVEIRCDLYVVRSDPEDNKLIELAASGQADFLITSDRAVLGIEEFNEIRILKPGQFIDRVEKESCICRNTAALGSKLIRLYTKLLDHFGSQGWWPAESAFEVIIGAILTQNTNWNNTEKAIIALKKQDLLEARKIAETPAQRIEELIRPTGYFRQKTERIKRISLHLMDEWAGDLGNLFDKPLLKARQELLNINGLGPETVDSILLYAGNKPIFVIDAYTVRLCERMGLAYDETYEGLRKFFERNLPIDVKLYQEFHALIVEHGKQHCRAKSQVSRCDVCPVEEDCEVNLFAKV